MTSSSEQQDLCRRHKAQFAPPVAGATLGAALPLALGAPVHGQRFPPEPGTSGWYLWTGGGDLADGEFRDVPIEEAAAIDPRVVKSSDRMFEEPTLRAVAKWQFEPGRRAGRIVRFRMAVPVVFNLNE